MDEQGATDAVATAVEVVEAFTDRLAPHEQWWGRLSPLLTPEAQFLYESVDPWKVPAGAVTDTGRVDSAPDSTSLVVAVGTDVGVYQVTVVRQSVEHPWLALTITAPQDAS